MIREWFRRMLCYFDACGKRKITVYLETGPIIWGTQCRCGRLTRCARASSEVWIGEK